MSALVRVVLWKFWMFLSQMLYKCYFSVVLRRPGKVQ